MLQIPHEHAVGCVRGTSRIAKIGAAYNSSPNITDVNAAYSGGSCDGGGHHFWDTR
jgi:hypothetical protein